MVHPTVVEPMITRASVPFSTLRDERTTVVIAMVWEWGKEENIHLLCDCASYKIYLCSILWVELEGGQARADILMS